MKLTYSLLAAAFACGLASAQTAYTTPVGYVTETLRPNRYNLIGLNLHGQTLAAGVLTGESSTGVTAGSVDFSTLLTAGKTYILELPDGTVQEIVSWTGSTLTTPEDISGVVEPGTTTFVLRQAATISSVFGANNSVGLTASADGGLETCDTVVVSTSTGLVTIYYFDDGAGTTGWYDAGGAPAEDVVLPYPDGFFVQRVGGSDIDLVVTGELKKTPTKGALVGGYNYLSSVAPAGTGLTLTTSGLSAYISHSADGDPTTVDNVLLAKTDGSYVTCYFFDDGAGTTGWYDASGAPADDFVLTSGFLIYNVGATKPLTVAVPSSYTTL